jgi:4-hydroxy-2-oxovalerate aldolase
MSSAGIKYIEIGNNYGLGSYHKVEFPLNDEDYMRICLPCKNDSFLGMFFFAGYGDRQDIKAFKEYGGDFVRVGGNATEVETTFEDISYAKSLGLFVSCNIMKTYAISRYRLAKIAEGIVKAGADCIYIVDSAGGMMPDQVSEYVKAIKEFYDVHVGFHGHNNLLLANANSLAALQAGADFVDATLRGIGRGAGNTQLESLIAICQKAHLMPYNCNALELAELAEKVVGNLMLKGSTKREINVGMVNFHDSYTGVLENVSAKYGVDPDILMAEVCKINVINPSEELFELAAKRLNEGKKFEFIPAYTHKIY